MPVKPKHSLGVARPRAARQFTDREEFIAAFQRELAVRCPDEPRVLVFYGVGGIGKTSLRRELGKMLEAAQDQTVWAALDFDVPSYREPETALYVLAKSLRDRSKAPFPTFDIAYAYYWQKTRPQTPLTKSTFPLLAESDSLAEIIGLAGDLPFVGVVPKLAGLVARGGQFLKDWWTKRGCRELCELPGLEPAQLTERLPAFWAGDLKDHLQRKDTAAALFLDTYEALTEGERSAGKLYQHDEWVRELVAQLPEVLWVICGRERLRWEEADPDWGKCLSQHLVGGLADADARTFLASCGIGDGAVQQAIIKGSQGVPYYLDLAVDTYHEIRETKGREPVPADFAQTPMAVFMRFLRHLTQPEVETLKVLAVPRFWDTGLFELLVKGFQTGYPLTAFSDLCRFSFINEEAAPGTWTMHQLMRQSLQEHTSPELVKRVHRLLFELYGGQLKDIDIKGITDRQKAALAEAFYHGRAALAVQEFFQWFLKPAKQFEQAAQWRLLVPLYEQVSHDLEIALGPEHPDVAQSQDNLAVLLHEQGKYAEAEPLYQRALAIREKALGPEHPNVAESLNNMAELLRAQGKYAEAEPLYRRALAIREKVLGPEHPDAATSLNDLAMLLSAQGKYAEAEPLCRRALAIKERVLGPEHPSAAMSLNNLALLLKLQGKYAEAEPLYRRALAIREKVLGPEHPEVAVSLNNLARLLQDQDKYAEAEPLFRRALAIKERVLGPEHPSVAMSLNNLAAHLHAQGKYTEAEPLCRRALAIREKALGSEHPNVAESLNNLAELLKSQGKYAEVEPLHRRAMAIWEKALGPEHPDVATSLYHLAELLDSQAKYAEAEPLYRRALAIREKALGPKHPRVAKVLENLAALCRATGRDDEAKELEQRVAEIRSGEK
jgi:tetratricopeptide (TPR) repeat protein